MEKKILERSNGTCELCNQQNADVIFHVDGSTRTELDCHINLCTTCNDNIDTETNLEYWRLLNESIWSEIDAVKVLSFRILKKHTSIGWMQDLLDSIYLDEDTLLWAQSTNSSSENDSTVHKDCNGVVLSAGDSVVLVKDLNVKGSSIVAKRGTAVRRISLDYDNEEYIEGKVNGQQIVILTKFVKKL